jgi:hypothetical protein
MLRLGHNWLEAATTESALQSRFWRAHAAISIVSAPTRAPIAYAISSFMFGLIEKSTLFTSAA